MVYKKELLFLISILISVGAKTFTPISYEIDKTAPLKVRNVRKVNPLQSGKVLAKNVDFARLFKNLRQNRSPEEIRIVSTLGLLSGALQVEEAIRENLYEMTDDLLASFNKSTPKENMNKLMAIEETINRDKSAVSILNGMLQYARNVTTLDALENDLKQILRENTAASKRLRSKKYTLNREIGERTGQNSASTGKLLTRSGMNLKYTMKEKLYDVREMIDNHVENIHSSVTENVKQTIGYLQSLQKTNKKLMKTIVKSNVKLDPSLNAVKRLWDQVASPEHKHSDFDVELNYHGRRAEARPDVIRFKDGRLTKGEEIATKPDVIVVDTKLGRFKRYNDPHPEMSFVIDIDIGGEKMFARQDEKMRARQDEDKREDDNDNEIDGNRMKDEDEMGEQNMDEEFDESPEQSDGPGGLVGLISNLSGGAEGSDIGAVLGAVSQVITNLLGPGGLDIPGLVSSGTALLASLLSGDENFGKVLGNIVGLAIEGFSGGGGAPNNGQFFGQFIGKFISLLSADPEDDDAPLQPDKFIENLYDGIGKGSAGDPEEREGEEANPECDHGSDSTSFVKSLISGLVNVFSKAIASSAAGSSQGSLNGAASFSGGSSHGSSSSSSKPKDDGNKERKR
ncbi:uncharacterized protein LOC116342091 [Contarinia nasturtii]|uniref:uncharacterized protein LOC116342091 n=1 Tax=Contarinia nasturtii TaxID=265458 RepID=UPI0012D402AD|nr:uncharacterized protein LOC116342091 [Contarinia nasturtii]